MARLSIAVLVAAFSFALAGCGSTEEPQNVELAYENLEKALVNQDPAACSMMTGDYRNKLAASAQLFESDCPATVREVGKGLNEDPELRTTRITDVTVNGETASLIAFSKYEGKDVRVKASFVRGRNGDWLLHRDRQLDDVAPSAPLDAYRAYVAAFTAGEGKKACALSTARGQELIIRSVPKSHGGGDCDGAVPYLAPAVRGLPEADIVGGETGGDATSLYTLQSNGSGSWISRTVVMKRESGKWLFDYSQDLGMSPAKRVEGGPVA